MIAQLSRRQKTYLLFVLPYILTAVLLNLIDVVPGPKNFNYFAFWIIISILLYGFSVCVCLLPVMVYQIATHALTLVRRRLSKRDLLV
jgi:uncharacterized membrane protein YczE